VLLPFSSAAYGRFYQALEQGKMQPRWEQGLYIGRSAISGEHILLTPTGPLMTRSVKPAVETEVNDEVNNESKEQEIYEDKYEPLKAKVLTIFSEKTPLESAVCGGLIALGLDIDPGLTGDDALVGNVIKINNNFSDNNEFYVTKKIQLNIKYFDIFNKDLLSQHNKFVLNINMNNIQAEIQENYFVFDKAIYIEKNDNITISIKNQEGLQVIGTGKLITCEKF
jgi:translation initiation factor 2 gamma subunit (eIF-2gamma)